MTPRGIIQKNPGNIRFVAGVPLFVGQGGHGQSGFAVFDTAAHGIRAIAVVLLTYYRSHGIRTITQAISRWAPGSENDTGAYIANVSAWTGYGKDELLVFADLFVLAKLVAAIIRQEIGLRQLYTDRQIWSSCVDAIGAN